MIANNIVSGNTASAELLGWQRMFSGHQSITLHPTACVACERNREYEQNCLRSSCPGVIQTLFRRYLVLRLKRYEGVLCGSNLNNVRVRRNRTTSLECCDIISGDRQSGSWSRSGRAPFGLTRQQHWGRPSSRHISVPAGNQGFNAYVLWDLLEIIAHRTGLIPRDKLLGISLKLCVERSEALP